MIYCLAMPTARLLVSCSYIIISILYQERRNRLNPLTPRLHIDLDTLYLNNSLWGCLDIWSYLREVSFLWWRTTPLREDLAIDQHVGGRGVGWCWAEQGGGGQWVVDILKITETGNSTRLSIMCPLGRFISDDSISNQNRPKFKRSKKTLPGLILPEKGDAERENLHLIWKSVGKLS